MEHGILSPAERIKAICKYFNVAVYRLEEETTIGRETLARVVKGKTKKVSPNVVQLICSKYPIISREWLKDGVGEMIVKNAEFQRNFNGVSTPPNNSELIQELRNQIAEQKATIERLNNKIDAMEEQYAKERRELRDSHERIMLDAQQKHKEAEESQLRTVNTLCRAMQVNSQQANDVIQGNKYLSPGGGTNGGYGVADPIHAHKRININDK